MAGRPKQFDPSSALDRAMMLFWEKGYERTSLCDLLSHMGISRQSLYDTFGDKHSLYLATLDHYVKRRMRELVGDILEDEASLPQIRAVFTRFETFAKTDSRKPCMMSVSSMELGADDPAVRERVRAQFAEVETHFERALRNALRKGELHDVSDPRAVARYLVNTLQGLGVMLKGGADPEHVHDVVRVALSLLR